ncbi:MAG: hypothetical protein V3T49_07250, partial [Dehalococcoidia bacterium]
LARAAQAAVTPVTSVAELVGIAVMTEGWPDRLERQRRRDKWIQWFYKHFGGAASAEDRRWAASQRQMGAWTRADVYVPWYEHSEEELKRNRLV